VNIDDIELARKLCGEIMEADCDSAREQQLFYLLNAVMNEDQDQIKIRTALLNRQAVSVC
jgi:hypothetical protein